MRVADLSAFTRDAIARTHGAVEDIDTTSPTWDGFCLHIARLTEEAHVLHEVAHWIVAEGDNRDFRRERRAANYALGTDPDGGPETGAWSTNEYYRSHKEVEATLVTQSLLRDAGLVRGYGATAAALPWYEGGDEARFWLIVADLGTRGICVAHPLRGLSPKKVRGRQLRLAPFS